MAVDVRVKKTKKAIRSAFISLLEEKSFSDITIQDISDRAEISRSTFYDHYTDKYQLLESMYQEIIDRFGEMADIYFCDRPHDDKKVMAKKALDRVIGDAEVIRVLLKMEEPGWDLTSRIQSALKPRCMEYLQKEDDDFFHLGKEFVAGVYTYLVSYAMQWIAEHQNKDDFPGLLDLSAKISSFFYKR